MSNKTVQPEEFSSALVGLFDDYGEAVMEKVKKAVDVTTKELVKETKQTAPKRAVGGRPAGTFANHISSKKMLDTRMAYSTIWYVRSPEYPLAHLLNNGHALRQGGYWGGTGFLTKASQTHAKQFEKRIVEAIRNAGR